MSYSATVIQVEESMQKEKINCMCGNKAQLIFKTKLGRIKDKIITIHGVPVYTCDDCDSNFMNGSDSTKFAKRVDEAYEKGIDSINF